MNLVTRRALLVVAAIASASLGCGRIWYVPVEGVRDGGVTDGAMDGAVPADGLVGDAFLSDGAPMDAGPTDGRGPVVPVDDGLIGWWSFNEGGGVVRDYSRSSNDGAIVAPAYAPGVIGQAMRFDGMDDEVAMGDVRNIYDFGSGAFSLEAWVNTTDDCSGQVVIFSRYSGSVAWNLSCERGGFASTRIRDSAGVIFDAESSTTRIDDGAWHHLVGIRRLDVLELWVDGVMEASTPAIFTGNFDSDADVTIGSHGLDGRHIAAVIDEVRLWSRDLSPAEVQMLNGALRPGLVGYWSFDGDASGHAGLTVDGAPMGGVSFGPGHAGEAAFFDGVDGRIDLAIPDFFSVTYTAIAWFRTAGTGGSQMILNREAGGDSPIHLHVQEARLRVNTRSSGGVGLGADYDVDLTDDQWHQAAVVRVGGDGEMGEMRLFVDGVRQTTNSGTFDTGTAAAGAPFVIGYRNGGDPRAFRGAIDEVQVYNRALTDAEIADLNRVYR